VYDHVIAKGVAGLVAVPGRPFVKAGPTLRHGLQRNALS
jgi:hypothetical protein